MAIWKKVHDAITNGHMPPKNKARPEAAVMQAVMEDSNVRLSDATADAARQLRLAPEPAGRMS